MARNSIGGEADVTFKDVQFCRYSVTRSNTALLANSVFQLPHAQGGEEERFGPGERTGGGHGVFAIAVTAGAVTGTAGFFSGLIFPHSTCGWTGDVGVAAVHNCWFIYNYHVI